MLARLFSFFVWALVASAVVFWGLRLFTRTPAAPPNAVVASETTTARGDLTRLLGAPTAPVAAAQVAAPEASARFRLLGIMAPKAGAPSAPGHGVALIAVDGKLPRAYTVGSRLDGEWVLQSVSLRTADIGPNAAAPAVRLELPVLPVAATGTLPSIVAPGAPPIRFNPVGPQGTRPGAFGIPPQAVPAPTVLPVLTDAGIPAVSQSQAQQPSQAQPQPQPQQRPSTLPAD